MPSTILITGCSTGIGQALAWELHQRGQRVIATARRPEALAALQELGMTTLALDVNDAASIQALLGELAARGLAVDMLINNAGYGAMGPLLELPLSELRAQFETNVFAIMALVQALAPGMIERGQGRIVNIGSVSGVLPTPFAGAYCATKAAVHALSDALRMELAPFGIAVQVIQPGAIQSQFGATASQGVVSRNDTVSLYAPVREAIAARANASQDHATTAEDFARAMADAVLAASPRPTVRIGNGSTLLPLLKQALPTPLLDKVLSRRFTLDKLSRRC